MRIISGKYRGLKLAEFGGGDIRPTADRVKESLFNIISACVQGASVLDLFCGSGNLGIECLSRGAGEVHFNDVSLKSLAVLKKNLAKIRENNYKITNLGYDACLFTGGRYGLIFIDPPYRSEYGTASLRIIGERGLLQTDGLAVFESDKSFVGEVDGLEMYDERKYGNTYLSFFRERGIR